MGGMNRQSVLLLVTRETFCTAASIASPPLREPLSHVPESDGLLSLRLRHNRFKMPCAHPHQTCIKLSRNVDEEAGKISMRHQTGFGCRTASGKLSGTGVSVVTHPAKNIRHRYTPSCILDVPGGMGRRD